MEFGFTIAYLSYRYNEEYQHKAKNKGVQVSFPELPKHTLASILKILGLSMFAGFFCFMLVAVYNGVVN
jgi:hypothetical protein